MKSVIVFVTLVAGVCCQVPFIGRCPAVSVKQNFQVSQYTGKWFEYSKYFAIFQFGGRCTTATYTDNQDGSVKVLNRQLNLITNKETTIEGKAVLAGNPGEAKLRVTFPSIPFQSNSGSNYWVLDTDYSEYAAVYSCNDFGFFNIKFAWLLTRSATPSQQVLDRAYSVFERNGVNKNFLLRTDQSRC